MIYYYNNGIMIRNMQISDAKRITREELAQGWNATITKYQKRLADQTAGRAISFAAEYRGNIAGYIHVYLDTKDGPFAGKGYPEIVDFGVLEKYRRHGIGGKLMDVAEQAASQYADIVSLGVGLHSGYGSAQRMYIRRGYLPDGTGVWYQGKPCPQYAPCCNDDGLVLFLYKKLR